MPRDGATETDPDQEHWPVVGRPNTTYVGMLDDGSHGVYDQDSGELLRAKEVPGKQELQPNEPLGSVEDALGQRIEAFGEEVGWESLSEFAQEHLESDEE